ncbi:hypothetical protein [Sphingomonas xinjiangensis]|uniref:Uncharacterized protein n=1 Tax=Sphingomonas xinjiangensis TaxID=643568 RepID=A0A840YQ73_9SPHN|nr:hypothetical protein [Sphingomonas xinjiangensis]MBB5710562.1 hypothetical protein [Sphingomonas xinjiangensis]
MQRPLVIDSHARRHPFRSHVRRAIVRDRQTRDDSDVKLFALSFSAFFVCFYTFLL